MSAPNLKEIEWAIQELEKEESSFPVYAKLASLYTMRNEMLGLSAPKRQMSAYSEEPMPNQGKLGQYGDSDFLRAVDGKNPADAWAVMDELMETLQFANERVYNSVMGKLRRL